MCQKYLKKLRFRIVFPSNKKPLLSIPNVWKAFQYIYYSCVIHSLILNSDQFILWMRLSTLNIMDSLKNENKTFDYLVSKVFGENALLHFLLFNILLNWYSMGEKHFNYSYVIHCLILNSDKVFMNATKYTLNAIVLNSLKKWKYKTFLLSASVKYTYKTCTFTLFFIQKSISLNQY